MAIIGAFIVLFANAAVSAETATNPGANGYSVSPSLNTITIQAGTTKSLTIYVQNISHATEQVTTITDNFIASPTNNGSPEILLNGGSTSRGLKQYISIPDANFTLQPGQLKPVTVNIAIPANTESGGYYAAIRFAPQSFATGRNINLTGSVTSLIMVTIPGNLRQQLNIVKFGAGDSSGQIDSLFTSSKNIYGVVYFNNTGNIQSQPFGNFTVKQGKGEIYNVPMNKDGGYILPASERYFTSKLQHIGPIGKYTIYGNFGFGTHGELLSAKANFYVIPLWLIWSVMVLMIAAIVFLVIYFGFVRRHKNRINR